MTIIIVVVKIFYVITLTDPNSESKVKLLMSSNIYVPRDEHFGHLKMSDFLAFQLKSIAQFLKPELESIFDSTPNEFDSFQDVLKLYEGGVKLPNGLLETIRDNIPAEMLKQIFPTDGEGLLKYPMPQVIKGIISFSDTIIS
jgi:linoleate 9S-lipoxygenase